MKAHEKPVLLLDVDEVLFPFAHAYDRWLVRTRGEGLNPELLARYEIPQAAGEDHNTLVARFLADERVLKEETPLAEARALVNEAQEKYRLVACTARHESDEGASTREWLQTHLPQIEMVRFMRVERGSKAVRKSQTAIEMGAVMLIDDTATHVSDLPRRCEGVVVRRPQGLRSDTGARDWEEVKAAVRALNHQQ